MIAKELTLIEIWEGELESNSNEALVPVVGRIDKNVVVCRELLDRNNVFVIYSAR
jgi:hypothetical protein